MMAQYLSPGVYVEEVPSGSRPIAGVGTSTAGFIGVVGGEVSMPPIPGKIDTNGKPVPYSVAAAGEPQLITSWEAFKKNFGDFQAGNQILAHAVYGFFNNGGTRCWVARVAGPSKADPKAKTSTKKGDAEGKTASKDDAEDAGGIAGQVQAVLEKFAAIDEIAIVAMPGALDISIQTNIKTHCENLQDRFAILDGQQTDTLTAEAIKGQLGDSQYAAMYFPWIQVYDPVTAGTISVPPSGHIAGVYARVDAQRGVHKTPANEVIRGALGVEKRLSKADQDGLNPAGVNVIRLFNGNVTVWGGRTLGGDSNGEWKYISVRRLFNFLRESIDEGTQWVVFEPNTPDLWTQIRRNVSAFLNTVWASGALFGNTPQEAYFVRCDETTNPPEVRDLGQVVTEVGVAVVRPAEFVIFRISQWAGPGQ
jgi:phage tail sheath protein FI